MIPVTFKNRWAWGASTLLILILIGTGPAFAAGQEGDWRPVYDLIMRWLNFGILAFLIVKFSRKPLANFLKGKKEEIARDIHRVENDLAQAKGRNLEARREIDAGKIRLEKLRERIVKQGEKEKLRIVEEARQESLMMLAGAREKIEGQILMARNTIKKEMVDAAFNLATQQLPPEINPEDHRNFLDQYLKKAIPQ